MTDLAKGIIEINGFTVKHGTTLAEMQSFFGNKVRVLNLSTGPRLKLETPFYLSNTFHAYAFNFNEKGALTHFSLTPDIPAELSGEYEEIAKYKLTAAKQWLKGMVNTQPEEDEESVIYSYDWGYIVSLVSHDRDYGLRGGEIIIRFREG